MNKKKVQVVICVKELDCPNFLLLQMNAKRNNYWQNVTGSVEKGESIQQAAIREVVEETGLDQNNIVSISQIDLIFHFHDQWHNDVEESVFLIQCENKWEIQLDPIEHQSFKWITKEEFSNNVVHYKSNFIALTEALKVL